MCVCKALHAQAVVGRVGGWVGAWRATGHVGFGKGGGGVRAQLARSAGRGVMLPLVRVCSDQRGRLVAAEVRWGRRGGGGRARRRSGCGLQWGRLCWLCLMVGGRRLLCAGSGYKVKHLAVHVIPCKWHVPFYVIALNGLSQLVPSGGDSGACSCACKHLAVMASFKPAAHHGGWAGLGRM